ncbi:zinc finger CCCH domain-containing protein 14-like [Primulina eburnea]|uniref:zinc finger CCCH domain-containing protein 14-like n=1 Tax=Primulina eburnea TaxID=1245227 RepID=UPI003C6C7A71
MQKKSCANDDFADADQKSSAASSAFAAPIHFSRCNPFVLPLSPTCMNSNASSYSALFQNCFPNSTSDTSSFDGDGAPADRKGFSSGSILEYQQLYNRYTLCLAQLHDSIAEADSLRLENDALRLSNADLSNRVAVLFSCDRFLCEFNRLNVASPSTAPRASHIAPPQALSEHNRVERKNTERVALPQSISVRSTGYLKINHCSGTETTRRKPASQSIPESQRVCVPLSKKEEEALEFDVYSQGMFKTELCDKWQETGTCPHGENCRFAHGINELRPVIRHPRYKTEVCRKVLTGDVCEYDRRCHFRHSLTEQERLMAATTPR